MSDMDRILEIQPINQFSEIVGIGIEIVPLPRLTGPAVPATIMGYAAITAGGQKEHLVLKSICAQRPSMAEHDRLASAPVVEVDVGAIFRGDRAHRLCLLHSRIETKIAFDRCFSANITRQTRCIHQTIPTQNKYRSCTLCQSYLRLPGSYLGIKRR